MEFLINFFSNALIKFFYFLNCLPSLFFKFFYVLAINDFFTFFFYFSTSEVYEFYIHFFLNLVFIFYFILVFYVIAFINFFRTYFFDNFKSFRILIVFVKELYPNNTDLQLELIRDFYFFFYNLVVFIEVFLKSSIILSMGFISFNFPYLDFSPARVSRSGDSIYFYRSRFYYARPFFDSSYYNYVSNSLNSSSEIPKRWNKNIFEKSLPSDGFSFSTNFDVYWDLQYLLSMDDATMLHRKFFPYWKLDRDLKFLDSRSNFGFQDFFFNDSLHPDNRFSYNYYPKYYQLNRFNYNSTNYFRSELDTYPVHYKNFLQPRLFFPIFGSHGNKFLKFDVRAPSKGKFAKIYSRNKIGFRDRRWAPASSIYRKTVQTEEFSPDHLTSVLKMYQLFLSEKVRTYDRPRIRKNFYFRQLNSALPEFQSDNYNLLKSHNRFHRIFSDFATGFYIERGKIKIDPKVAVKKDKEKIYESKDIKYFFSSLNNLKFKARVFRFARPHKRIRVRGIVTLGDPLFKHHSYIKKNLSLLRFQSKNFKVFGSFSSSLNEKEPNTLKSKPSAKTFYLKDQPFRFSDNFRKNLSRSRWSSFNLFDNKPRSLKDFFLPEYKRFRRYTNFFFYGSGHKVNRKLNILFKMPSNRKKPFYFTNTKEFLDRRRSKRRYYMVVNRAYNRIGDSFRFNDKLAFDSTTSKQAQYFFPTIIKDYFRSFLTLGLGDVPFYQGVSYSKRSFFSFLNKFWFKFFRSNSNFDNINILSSYDLRNNRFDRHLSKSFFSRVKGNRKMKRRRLYKHFSNYQKIYYKKKINMRKLPQTYQRLGIDKDTGLFKRTTKIKRYLEEKGVSTFSSKYSGFGSSYFFYSNEDKNLKDRVYLPILFDKRSFANRLNESRLVSSHIVDRLLVNYKIFLLKNTRFDKFRNSKSPRRLNALNSLRSKSKFDESKVINKSKKYLKDFFHRAGFKNSSVLANSSLSSNSFRPFYGYSSLSSLNFFKRGVYQKFLDYMNHYIFLIYTFRKRGLLDNIDSYKLSDISVQPPSKSSDNFFFLDFYTFSYRTFYFFRKLVRFIIFKPFEPQIRSDFDSIKKDPSFSSVLFYLFGRSDSTGEELTDFFLTFLKGSFFGYLSRLVVIFLVVFFSFLGNLLKLFTNFCFFHPFFFLSLLLFIFYFFYRGLKKYDFIYFKVLKGSLKHNFLWKFFLKFYDFYLSLRKRYLLNKEIDPRKFLNDLKRRYSEDSADYAPRMYVSTDKLLDYLSTFSLANDLSKSIYNLIGFFFNFMIRPFLPIFRLFRKLKIELFLFFKNFFCFIFYSYSLKSENNYLFVKNLNFLKANYTKFFFSKLNFSNIFEKFSVVFSNLLASILKYLYSKLLILKHNPIFIKFYGFLNIPTYSNFMRLLHRIRNRFYKFFKK